MTTLYKLSIAFILSLSVLSIHAQTDTLSVGSEAEQQQINENLKNEEVEVVKAFRAQLANANSLNVSPTLPEVKEVSRKYNYDITIVPYNIEYADPEIKPFAMKGDEPKEIHKFYAKLGYGNFKSPIADVSYHNSFGKTSVGFLGKYLALDNDSNNRYQKMQDIDLALHTNTKVSEMFNLGVSAFTQLDKRYLFHIPLNSEPNDYTEENTLRNINNYGARIAIKNSSDYALQYILGLNGSLLDMSNNDAKELNLKADTDISYAGKNLGVGLDGILYYSDLSEIADTNYLTYTASPHVFYQREIAHVSLGANITGANDSLYIFPEAELLVDVIKNRVQLSLGVAQEAIHNNIDRSIAHNPYYEFSQDDYRTTITKKYFLGAQGQLSNITYRAQAGYKQIANQVFYLSQAEDGRKFSQQFLDVSAIFVSGQVDYTLNETFTIGANISQHFFDLEENEKLYHVPSLRMTAFTDINLLDNKLHVRPSVSITDKVDYIDAAGNAQKLDNLLNLSAVADYQILDRIRLFAEVKNILSNNYTEYFGYDDVGLHTHGGLKVRF